MRTLFVVFVALMTALPISAQTTATDGDWKANSAVLKNTPEADVMIRVGDIDNLGFGFQPGFNPFTGKSTEVHQYPWLPAKSDVPGLDRILIGTGFGKVPQPCGGDGYTGSRPGHPVPIVLPLDACKGLKITGATLTMFVDDFQTPVLCSRFRAYVNGRRLNDLENVLRALNQSGPIGKFVSVKLPAELLPLLAGNKLSVLIDDSTSGAADGFALDFVKLLVNPKAVLYKNTITGYVKRRDGEGPIAGALVTVRGYGETTTDSDGKFTLTDIPAGLNVADASAEGYQSNSAVYDVVAGEEVEEQTIYLDQAKDIDFAGRRLKVGENLILNNIQFDKASADLRPASKAELDKLVALMNDNPRMEIELSGHTSAEGDAAMNTALSQRRVQSCKGYLIQKGVDEGRLNAVGYGPAHPIADNTTEAGREKNRRVEMRVIKM